MKPNKNRRLELPLSGMRKACGKTVKEVAESMKTSPAFVEMIEKRGCYSVLRAYAKALGFEIALVMPSGEHIYLKGSE
jgi:transcriptional regulator